MPRTRLDKKKNEALAVMVNGYVHKDSGTIRDACDKMQKEYRTMCRRLADPGTFTIDELLTFGRKYNVPIDELRAAIRY